MAVVNEAGPAVVIRLVARAGDLVRHTSTGAAEAPGDGAFADVGTGEEVPPHAVAAIDSATTKGAASFIAHR